MAENKVYTAIGLMSGTSLDGIDAAMVQTDGRDNTLLLAFKTYFYDEETREAIRKVLRRGSPDEETARAETLITQAHIKAVRDFTGFAGHRPDIIGFHGQTITHEPARRFTWQLGDGQSLADETGFDVVCDMRQNDIKHGGQGAPLLPLCHRAFAGEIEKPIAILNLGGVGNVTWLGVEWEDVMAFDTGPANALIDDLVKSKTGKNYDSDGRLARAGKPNRHMINDWMMHEYFQKPPPKSLDRNEWEVRRAYDLELEDAVATLAEFTVQSVAHSMMQLPGRPHALYVTGGGRHNSYIMMRLNQMLPYSVKPVESLGWNGDGLEAQGFAYLAVRSLLGLPLTLPSTTGVAEPITGGVLYKGSENLALRPA
jgi:anhydro-N-acetylmuramic acid kinase